MQDLASTLIGSIVDGVKYESKLRLAINGLSGDGKTFTALLLAQRLCEKLGPDAYILGADSEHQSMLKYADIIKFRHLSLPNHTIDTYLAVIEAAERLNEVQPVVLVIDSGSHSWMGRGGALEEVDAYAESHRTSRGAKNSFNAWSQTRPKLNRLEDRINDCNVHVIVTYRLKKKNIQTVDENGRSTIQSVGLEVVAPDGIEYIFDLVADMTRQKELVVTKTRCPMLAGQTFKPIKSTYPLLQLHKEAPDSTIGIADTLWSWLKGAPMLVAKPEPPKEQKEQTNGAPTASKVFQDLEADFRKIGEVATFLNTLEEYGLIEQFRVNHMDDKEIKDRARAVYGVLKAIFPLKLKAYTLRELERKQQAASQQADKSTAADSPTAPVAEPAPTTDQRSPARQTEDDGSAEDVPQAPPISEDRPVEISDFTKAELATILKALKPLRAKGFNNAALCGEIFDFAGTRGQFLRSVDDEVAQKQQYGGAK